MAVVLAITVVYCSVFPVASEDNFSCIYANLKTYIMNFILELLVNAGVLFLLAAALPSINIKSYGTAIGVALVVGILNATTGWLMRLPLNLITFGLLSFVVRLVVTAVIITIAHKLFSGFEVKGWTASFCTGCMYCGGGNNS